jgi:hypothetical protein
VTSWWWRGHIIGLLHIIRRFYIIGLRGHIIIGLGCYISRSAKV